MNFLLNLLVIVQILSALAMIGLILVQHGKGADMGAAFGSGASGSVFGATGSANFLSRSTAVLAVIFFISTLLLAYFGNQRPTANGSGSVLDALSAVPAVTATASQPAHDPVSLIPGNAPVAAASAIAAPAISTASQ